MKLLNLSLLIVLMSAAAIAGPKESAAEPKAKCLPVITSVLETPAKVVPLRAANHQVNQSFNLGTSTTVYQNGKYISVQPGKTEAMDLVVYGVKFENVEVFDGTTTSQPYSVATINRTKNRIEDREAVLRLDFPASLYSQPNTVVVHTIKNVLTLEGKREATINSTTVSNVINDTVFIPAIFEGLKASAGQASKTRSFVATVRKPYANAQERLTVAERANGLYNMSVFEVGPNAAVTRDTFSVPYGISGLPSRVYFTQLRENGMGSMVVTATQMVDGKKVSKLVFGNFAIPETKLGNVGLFKFANKVINQPEITAMDTLTPIIMADKENGIATYIAQSGGKQYLSVNKIFYDRVNNGSVLRSNYIAIVDGQVTAVELNFPNHKMQSLYPFKNGEGALLVAENKIGQTKTHLVKIGTGGKAIIDSESLTELQLRRIRDTQEFGKSVDVTLVNKVGAKENLMNAELDLNKQILESLTITQVFSRETGLPIYRALIKSSDILTGAHNYQTVLIPHSAVTEAVTATKISQEQYELLLEGSYTVERTDPSQNI